MLKDLYQLVYSPMSGESHDEQEMLDCFHREFFAVLDDHAGADSAATSSCGQRVREGRP
ncbi:MAG: hypothetical protein QOI73_2720 [Solirubrobacteraceae bacterium]|nr:hypothetical protein [Solirubrobacteraceae bacterium]